VGGATLNIRVQKSGVVACHVWSQLLTLLPRNLRQVSLGLPIWKYIYDTFLVGGSSRLKSKTRFKGQGGCFPVVSRIFLPVPGSAAKSSSRPVSSVGTDYIDRLLKDRMFQFAFKLWLLLTSVLVTVMSLAVTRELFRLHNGFNAFTAIM
jgi:hypothetical protein